MVVITPSDVKEVISTNLPDSVISGFIAFVDQADSCLDNNGVSDELQKSLKIYAVAHMIELQQGGSVKSETDMDGEGVTYTNEFKGSGLSSTSYGNLVQQMDTYGCVTRLYKIKRFAYAV